MSIVKSRLKFAREALAKKDYQTAKQAALEILDYDSDNYNAYVFLGLAQFELHEHAESEKAYHRAIAINAEPPLAWQGLSKFYEATEDWEQFGQILLRLMDIYNKIGDATKCAESLQKLLNLHRQHGKPPEVINALSLVLPTSSFYELFSSLPPPDPAVPTSNTSVVQEALYNSLPIVLEMIEILEKYEDDFLKKEVEKRRTRLGAAKPSVLRLEIGRELWGSSKLPSLYKEVINHPNTTDEVRHEMDARLLRYKQKYLRALPSTGSLAQTKADVLKEMEELAYGAVILRIPDEVAWMITLEAKDTDLPDYDNTLLIQFMETFPTSAMSSLLMGYFLYTGIQTTSNEDEEENRQGSSGDPYELIINAFPAVSQHLIANRILVELYLREHDYENAAKAGEDAFQVLARSENATGRILHKVRLGFEAALATSLVHFQPPKHHPRAEELIGRVLKEFPDNIPCLMGKGYIYEAAEKWQEATEIFDRVYHLIPEDVEIGLRAKENSAWSRCQLGDTDDGAHILQEVLSSLESLDGRDDDRSRCLWRLGMCDMRRGDAEKAYYFFIASLKTNSHYAPSFTSLGIYYSEYASSRDPIRASKCFQKAFELDPRESDAAKRLAEGFAEEQEWDLVDVIARRVIEADEDSGTESGVASFSFYNARVAWAWKALGIVELHRRNYAAAIHALQTVIRSVPGDHTLWLRLGEAYSATGKFVAATKALTRASELEPDDWMCAYLIGQVKQEMGLFAESIAIFVRILELRPSEIGVLMALGQSYLGLGCLEFSDGYDIRAEQSLTSCIQISLRALRERSSFRSLIWKTLGDSLFHLSRTPKFNNGYKVRNVVEDVMALLPNEELATSVLEFSVDPFTGLGVLRVAAAAYRHRISLEKSANKGSAWHDLGLALHTWSLRSSDTNRQRSTMKEAIECFTEALRCDPENPMFWTALGNANFLEDAGKCQHAYIKALEVNSKDVTAWTNLGLLYLLHGDLELANDILYRSQSIDPDYAAAWAGQALVAMKNQKAAQAKVILEHVASLSGDLLDTHLELASKTFSEYQRLGLERRQTSHDYLMSSFGHLASYCERRPDDVTALHLFSLISEALGHSEVSRAVLQSTIEMLESAYEESEDPMIERRYVIAHSNMARLQLCTGDYEHAAESFRVVLGLLPDDVDQASRTMRVSANFGLGLVNFRHNNVEEALAYFERAVASADNDTVLRGHALVLLSQMMWTIQSAGFVETAKEQLLDCVTKDPQNIEAINVLAGMGILTDDSNLVDAALSEITTMPLDQRHSSDPQRNVEDLLVHYHLGQNDLSSAFSVLQKAVFLEPSAPEARIELARLAVQTAHHQDAIAILSGPVITQEFENQSDVANSSSLRGVACLIGCGNPASSLREVQKAIMLAPSEMKYWRSLAYVRMQGQQY